VARTHKSVVLGVAAFLAGLIVANALDRGAWLPRLAAYAPEITAERGPKDEVVLRTSASGKRYLVIIDPTASGRRESRPRREAPTREGTTRISLHLQSLTLPPQEVANARVYELRQVMQCGPDPLCKICEPGPDDACTNPPEPNPQPPPFPPDGYGLHLLNAPRP